MQCTNRQQASINLWMIQQTSVHLCHWLIDNRVFLCGTGMSSSERERNRWCAKPTVGIEGDVVSCLYEIVKTSWSLREDKQLIISVSLSCSSLRQDRLNDSKPFQEKKSLKGRNTVNKFLQEFIVLLYLWSNLSLAMHWQARWLNHWVETAAGRY